MKKYVHTILTLTVLFILVNSNLYAVQYESKTDGGDWSDPTTWSPAGVPDCGDTITILAGYTVTLTANENYSSCSSPMFLEVYGLSLIHI